MTTPDQTDPSILRLLASQEERIVKLESPPRKSLLKQVSENASLTALFLGLVLTLASLYDTFITKPEVNRITNISQFNQAVNSAAKIRQDLIKLQMESSNAQLKLAATSSATPQILNDVATAKALLRNISDRDIGIPQLLILISEAFTSGEIDSAAEFVGRAVAKKDVSTILRSEALRYQARFLFLTNKPAEGRKVFDESIAILGDTPLTALEKASVIGDSVFYEFAMGDCQRLDQGIEQFAKGLKVPGLTVDSRQQLISSFKFGFAQYQGIHCPLPSALEREFPS